MPDDEPEHKEPEPPAKDGGVVDDDQGDPFVINRWTQNELTLYEVKADDLEQLDRFVADENQALGFFSGAIGIALGTLIALITCWNTVGAKVIAFLFGTLMMSAYATLSSGLKWSRARKARPKLIERIKSQTSPRRTLFPTRVDQRRLPPPR